MANNKPAAVAVQDWRGISDFNKTLEAIKAARECRLFPQVCVFEGRAGIGKARFAAQVAALFFCQQQRACGECEGCLEVMRQQQSDVLWINAAESTIKLADANNICEHMLTSSSGRARIGIIVDADKLNMQASNRLLKTCEELPEHAYLILTTSNYQHLLPTLRSRSLRWKLRKPTATAASPAALVDQELLDDISGLCSKAGPSEEALILIEALVKKYNLSANALATALEVALNASYKKQVATTGHAADEVLLLNEKRAYLRNIKRRAVKEKVALNTQLSFEGWVLH